MARIVGYDVLYSTNWGTPTRHMSIKVPRDKEIDNVHWFLASQIAKKRGVNKGDVVLIEWSPIHN